MSHYCLSFKASEEFSVKNSGILEFLSIQKNKSSIMFKNGFLSLLLMLCVSGFSFSQNLSHADKIIEVYGQEWFDRMQIEAPDLLILMDKYVNHGFSVRTVSEGKYDAELVPLEFIPLVSKTDTSITVEQFLIEAASPNFNPLRYEFFSTKDAQVYKLKGVNKIIYIIPQESILLK